MSEQREIVLIAHNLRSIHNVGSLMRTADGLGLTGLFLTGYTPHPPIPNDDRLPHERAKISRQISKTALGAESHVNWHYAPGLKKVITALKNNGFSIAALEQDVKSHPLQTYEAPKRIALIVGREVEGLEQEVKDLCDVILEIPMYGSKESFNVVQAAAMALYQFSYF